MTRERLRESHGLQWPCTDEKHPGTVRRYIEGDPFVPKGKATHYYGKKDGRAVVHLTPYEDRSDPVDEEWASSMLTFFDPRPTSAGMIGAGGLLYWQFNENWSNAEGTDSAILGGFVQFDPEAVAITGVWPLGDSVGAFTGENELSTSSQGTWHAIGDTVWFADARDDGDLLRLDPAAGVEAIDIAPVAGADYTRIELVPNDPDGVWLILEDWTVTESDESGTSASGRTRFVLVDERTGEFEVEVIESDLIGF